MEIMPRILVTLHPGSNSQRISRTTKHPARPSCHFCFLFMIVNRRLFGSVFPVEFFHPPLEIGDVLVEIVFGLHVFEEFA